MPRRAAVCALVIAVAVGGVVVFVSAPWWLPVQDRLRDCPALVVLNGDPPFRVDEATRLYHAGRGREVWLTADPASSDRDGDAGTRWNARRLISLGVPSASVHLVPGSALGTHAELTAVAAELRRRSFACAIVVTSPLHTRRAKLTWRRCIGASPEMIVRHPAGANYVGWSRVARELVGVARVWTGCETARD